MIDKLIALGVVIIIVGIVVYLVKLLLDLVPMDDRFKQIAWVLILLIAVLICLSKALPLLGINAGL